MVSPEFLNRDLVGLAQKAKSPSGPGLALNNSRSLEPLEDLLKVTLVDALMLCSVTYPDKTAMAVVGDVEDRPKTIPISFREL